MHKEIILATGNQGKLTELQQLLEPLGLVPRAQSEWAVPEAAETGLTFVENALLKARNACAHTQRPALADDSGLVVPALDGAPGVYSARYAGEAADAAQNNAKLLNALQGVQDRQAYFYCAMVYCRYTEDPAPLVGFGQWWGEIVQVARGSAGFGYDPLFLIPALQQTAAELQAEHKNRLSHRGQALRSLLEQLQLHAQSD